MSAEQAAAVIRARWPRLRVEGASASFIVVEGDGWRVSLWRAWRRDECDGMKYEPGWGSELRMELNDEHCDGGCQCATWHTDPCEAVALAVAAVTTALRAALERVAAEMQPAAEGGAQ